MEINVFSTPVSTGNSDQIKKELIITLQTVVFLKSFKNYRKRSNPQAVPIFDLEGKLAFDFKSGMTGNQLYNIKIASEKWNNLPKLDRLTVLDAYCILFKDELTDYNTVNKTLLFCEIFLHEFVGLLSSE